MSYKHEETSMKCLQRDGNGVHTAAAVDDLREAINRREDVSRRRAMKQTLHFVPSGSLHGLIARLSSRFAGGQALG